MFKIKLPKTHGTKAPKLKQQRGIILHTSKVDIWLLELKLQEIYGKGNYSIDGSNGLEDRLTISAIRDLEPEEIRQILQMQRDDPGNETDGEYNETIPQASGSGAADDSLRNDSQASAESSSQDTAKVSDVDEHISKPRARRREWWKRSKASTESSVELNVIGRKVVRSLVNGIR